MKPIHACLFAALALITVENATAQEKKDDTKARLQESPPQAQPKAGGNAAFDDTFSKAPTNITSQTLVLKAGERVFVYKGGVDVKQGDLSMKSDQLEGTYNEQNQIEKLIARGNVIIDKADIHATSKQALYDAATSVVTLTDNPQVTQQGSTLTADKIRIYLNENRSEAEGDVQVTVVNDKAEPTPVSAAAAGATPTPAVTVAPTATPAKKR